MKNQTVLDPQIQGLARQLVAYEAASLSLPEDHSLAVSRTAEKLRRPLSTLAGTSGFSALLTRAVILAKAQRPALNGVCVQADGSLEGWDELGGEEAVEAGITLIAQIIALLVAFIGADLTIRLVLTARPDLVVSPMQLP